MSAVEVDRPRHAVDHVECFPAPGHVTVVRFTTDELASVCPVTGQPDLSHLVIEYAPQRQCVESKSLKLYLWSFRDRAVFAEALAAEIAAEIMVEDACTALRRSARSSTWGTRPARRCARSPRPSSGWRTARAGCG